tara:strand:- start:725 stop:1702 length:978 start_codon:yes stop_codon:yes gene_type:complete
MGHIIIIGSGQIGSRHLQSLAKIDRETMVSVFDPSINSLNLAKERYNEMPHNNLVKSVSYSQNLDDLRNDVDVAVVATNADVRLQVLEKLLSRVGVRYLILEKVVFQSVDDFKDVLDLLKKNKTKAWINFSRRMMPFYKGIKNSIDSNEKVYIHLEEGDLGLIQSSIHFLDLLLFFTKEKQLFLDGSGIDGHVQKSKREGHVELTGLLRGKTEKCSEITVIDYPGSNASDVIHVFGKNIRFMFSETLSKAYIAKANNSWEWEEESFSVSYQSDLTHQAIEQALDTGKCELPSLEDSFLLHEAFLNMINDHLERITGKRHTKCPIT